MGWPKDAYVGQEVVCVSLDNMINLWHRSSPLSIGGVYRIIELHIFEDTLYFMVNDGTIRCWFASNFQPVEKRKTSITIFTAMLGPKQKETTNA